MGCNSVLSRSNLQYTKRKSQGWGMDTGKDRLGIMGWANLSERAPTMAKMMWSPGPGCPPIRPCPLVFTALTEQLPGSNLMGRPLQASLPSGGHVCTSWGPQLLLYSSTQQLKTLGTLRLRVAMLEQQIHLEKVLTEQKVKGCALGREPTPSRRLAKEKETPY